MIDISNSVENLVEKLLNPKGHVTAKTKEIFKITLKIKSKEGVSDPPINKKESPPKKLVHKLKKKKKNREKLETCTLNLSFEIVPLELLIFIFIIFS